jgi:signal transduction histidine kinase
MVLVGACTFAVFYLNYLHVNVAEGLTENVASETAAVGLENTTDNLVKLLRGPHEKPELFAEQVQAQNQELRTLLDQANALANLETEQVLVGEIRAGLKKYLEEWDHRVHPPSGGRQSPEQLADTDAQLARRLEEKVLRPCRELRVYNADQIRKSNSDNRDIVLTLQWGLLAVGVGGPLCGLILGYAVARSLHHSISQLSVRIRDAAGRLNRDLGSVTLEEEGDLPDLHREMQKITEEIERVVEQLQQREREVLRAEQLAAVGQVAAGVAHELRNPLTSVKMLVQTGLEGDQAAGLSREDLAIIEREVRRMEQCIRLFMDFARPPRSERRRSNLTDVIRRAMTLVEGRARRQKVQLAAHLPPQPIHLKIDPEQIHQVLVNLLLNALDALPHGGSVEVSLAGSGRNEKNGSVANASRSLVANASSSVQVCIRDSGPGIAPRIRERLFEPFVSSKETGLGLGLSICKRLIEAHGGTIHGDNPREGGASFSFTLPLDEDAHADAVGGG